jgi:hypothetical protein
MEVNRRMIIVELSTFSTLYIKLLHHFRNGLSNLNFIGRLNECVTDLK